MVANNIVYGSDFCGKPDIHLLGLLKSNSLQVFIVVVVAFVYF